MNSLVFVFGLLLLLVSINGLTPAPTNANGSPSEKPTPAPTGITDSSPGTVPTPHPTSIDGSILTPVPTSTSSNGISPSVGPTKSPINGVLSRCIATDQSLDIIFIIDSSGSVFDNDYKNWENELDLVYDMIDNAMPVNSRVGLINFSGCAPSYTFEQCKQENMLKTMISLNDNGSPNDLDDVLSTVAAIGQDDFNGGYTWTNDALTMALEEFHSNMDAESNKIIILISDGAPFPIQHAACQASTNYVSDTLISLRELGVDIITIGIDIEQDIKQVYFDCISDGNTDAHFEATFDSIPSLVPTQNGGAVPSYLPTPSPVSPTLDGSNGVPSEKPTPSPTGITGSSPGAVPTPAPTSDGSNTSPSNKPTPSPVSPTSDGSSHGVPSAQPTNVNGSPSEKPTPSPTAASPGTVPTPAPTADGSNGGSPSEKPTPSPTGITGSSPGTVPTPAPTNANGSPSKLPTPSPVSPTSDVSNGSPSEKPTPSPTAVSSPGTVPTPSPVSPTMDGSNGVSPTSVSSPGTVPTPSPTSDGSASSPTSMIAPGSVPTPAPTADGSNSSSPSPKPTPSPTGITGSSPGTVPTPSPVSPTMDGSNGVSPASVPTPSPTISGQPGTVPTPPPTTEGSASTPTSMLAPGSVPTPAPTAADSILTPVPTSSVVAIEDLSDLIGDFLCAELGSTRSIISTKPTASLSLVPTPSPVVKGGNTMEPTSVAHQISDGIMARIYGNLVIISGFIGYLLLLIILNLFDE